MENKIEQLAIGDLLNGRYFYIPSYQRGYRWTEKQVGDLLRDLLCFANENNGKEQFYCLQPIIAKPITDEEKLKFIFGTEYSDEIKTKGVWEVIDGQQRLTTIYLIYKYLLKEKGWDAETLRKKGNDKELYHILYATRKDSTSYLEGSETLSSNSTNNIDYFHISNAFNYIDQWIGSEGAKINERYHKGCDYDEIQSTLFQLLSRKKGVNDTTVQVLWYEIAEDNNKNAIKEFQNINTGKIKLTDAELIKGLFLQEKNFCSGERSDKRSEMALQWEFIENTLHANNFWYFLQEKDKDMPNRIDLIFSIIYKQNNLDKNEDKWDNELLKIDKLLSDPTQSEVFRYYYNLFDGKTNKELENAVAKEWEEVMNVFRIIDDWFNSPEIYNYIGLLSQCGVDVTKLIIHFMNMNDTSSLSDFINYLKTQITEQFKSVKAVVTTVIKNINGEDVEEEEGRLLNVYDDGRLINKILIALNVQLLNEQITNASANSVQDSDSNIYKFPFDLYNSQDWDIEHIDSFHTNSLKKLEDKKLWISTAQDDLEEELNDEKNKGLKDKIDNIVETNSKDLKDEQLNNIINEIKELAGEEELDEETKNSIGNLALLDSSTNRSYGNSLFRTKRRIILENIRAGVYVPLATQYVFAKLFDIKGTNRTRWTKEDMDEYNKFIYNNLKQFITPKNKQENN